MRLFLSDKRLILLGLLLLAIAAGFWLSSRYPSLNTKAMMGGQISLEDGLSYDALFSNSAQAGTMHAIWLTFINWVNTNIKGMTFGLAFAIVVLAGFPVLKSFLRGSPSSFRASIVGTFMGAPLGVCVNCAAPIAFGLYRGGARAETVLATMISSPTLNVVVLSMTLALFPLHVAVIKIALVFFVLLVLIPVLVRMFPNELHAPEPAGETVMPDIDSPAPSTWIAAIVWLSGAMWRSAIYVLIRMVPLMLLAGLLGAIAINLLPWEQLNDLLPTHRKPMILAAMFCIALFGLFLPVPIAFDVIIVAILIAAGLPMKYAATLLFVLGAFSVFSFLVLWGAGAKKLSVALALSIAGLGVVAGGATHYADQWYNRYIEDTYYSAIQDRDVVPQIIAALPPAQSDVDGAAPLNWSAHPTHAAIAVADLGSVSAPAGLDWRMTPKDVGFEAHSIPMRHAVALAEVYPASLAAADFNDDDALDVLVGNATGLHLYQNTGTGFARVDVHSSAISTGTPVSAAAFADINNDGAPDLMYAVPDDGVYLAYNTGGRFSAAQRLVELDARFALALAFGDVDANGELDILIGRHDLRFVGRLSEANSRDLLVLQNKGTFLVQPLADVPAETLSILVSDLNADGWPDRLHASEFEVPDNHYWGNPDLDWREMGRDAFSIGTANTMSIDSADINNDLLLDVYLGQITMNPSSPPVAIAQMTLPERRRIACVPGSEAQCNELLFRNARQANALGLCNAVPTELNADCIANVIYRNVAFASNRRPEDDFLSPNYPVLAGLRDRHLATAENTDLDLSNVHVDGVVPVDDHANRLHVQQADGSFVEQGAEMGVDIAGWTWNARFADLDGDGFQDLFVVNGWAQEPFDTENVWFRNLGGNGFENASRAAGLDDMRVTMSALQFDADNDGDLDVLTFAPTTGGTLQFYENTGSGNRHIQVELTSATTPIGAVVIIRTPDGGAQMREIKLSGGYQSHDPFIAHFGLGMNTAVSSIEVNWPDGTHQFLEGPFEGQHRYRISQ
ncbi:FG-GAP-like repeat-containing protein [Octadecabacter sp. G9-8]|uniref:FG-GAP-like repeat-containing protein n=1 Tax=Octadecabacter dasysiphoniae TaxID=2909341 RepID=A0ABS9D119_9RHOB|nr:FG-GAP-like repeat-containing protein [Octadecabacter dasysiphoniae]MCF2872325.1 FG-GAP-like repeat-containing protein [Octadecabacter dasysiphoniae]